MPLGRHMQNTRSKKKLKSSWIKKFQFPPLLYSFDIIPSCILTIVLSFKEPKVLLLSFPDFANDFYAHITLPKSKPHFVKKKPSQL